MKKSIKPSLLASAIALALASGPVSAEEYNLCAVVGDKALPDGTSVPVWGYAQDTGTGCPTAPEIPGPALPVTNGTLIINLTNNLPEPTSIVIPGQALPTPSSGPTWDDNSTGSRAGDLTKKVRSYGTETAALGGTGSYSFTVDRSGTFMYHSGTHPQKQVYMGLYGAVTLDADVTVPADGLADVGNVYPGVTYDNDITLFYSDIDPAFNAAVQAGTLTTAIERHPSWFLVNGEPYVAGSTLPITAGAAGTRTLVRFISAATEKHVPVFQGLYGEIHGEDGFQYNWQTGATVMDTSPRKQYSVGLPPLKTKDVIINPQADGIYAVYDGNGYMTNPSDPANPDDGGDTVGGMLRFLEVGLAAGTPPVANADAYSTKQNTPLAVAAPGVLGNDTDINGDALTASIATPPSIGVVNLISDGSFTYTPNLDSFGVDSFTYLANDGTNDSLPATVTITVSEDVAPVANADAYAMDQDTVLTVAVPGVLANDTDVNGDTLIAVLGTVLPTNGSLSLNADGSFTYTPTTDFVGTDSFTYLANDGTNDSPPTTVTITVNAVVANSPPVANDDIATTAEDTAVIVDVLANDSDVDGDALSVSAVTQGTNGSVVNNSGNVIYTPNANFTGSDSFTYVAKDGALDSNVATVNITVSPVNDAPVAEDDASSVPRRGEVTIPVLANDTDAEGNLTIDPATVVIESQPSGATAVANPDGTVTLTLTSGNRTVRIFTYTVKDDAGAISNIGTVTVTVN